MKLNLNFRKLIAICTLSFVLVGCQTTYYAVWEKLGKEKRHLLRDQVEKSRDDQEKHPKSLKMP